MIPIIDLHCDLLSYLAFDTSRTVTNPESRCSLQQMKEGGVKLQTLAAYSATKKGSVSFCQRQVEIFTQLPKRHPSEIAHLEGDNFLEKTPISVALSIENGSGLLEEDEDLSLFFTRFDQIREQAQPLYISLTWNTENRFGGGNESKKGISKDGERVLDYLDKTGIAIDLSHTSDALAHDILNYIDKKGLTLIPIASHSNFRVVSNQKRNLPDEIALAIGKRGGVIGLNFVRYFVGMADTDDFIKQIAHARSLGLLDNLCFGADFFYDDDLSSSLNHVIPFYFSKYSDASCYPALLDFFSSSLHNEEIKQISYSNAAEFLGRL